MLPYTAPQNEMLLSLLEVAGGRALLNDEFDEDTVKALLSEASKLAEDELAPDLSKSDKFPPTLSNGRVRVGKDMHHAHRQVSQNGWLAMPFNEEVGGLDLPWSVASLMLELADSSNVSFALSMCMTQGCAEAILTHGTSKQIEDYVPYLLSGKYMGTMQLTEASAGSDVGALKSIANPNNDGSWSIWGTKIYISWGDSDVSANIIHLVLARTPEGTPGTKGLSLFLVPSVLPDGTRNNIITAGLEEKLGIHGSPTCTLIHEGSQGWLIGPEFGGMAAMFTMMNNARIGVGFQGAGVSERALQAAREFAKGRVQGGKEIIQHMDVRRNLLIMKALTCASRDLGYSAHVAGDLSRLGGPESAKYKRRIDILTPIAKAFMTDAAIEVTNLGIQIHGGMGVIEEAGAAQLARDCRVFTIYEGTNGIQALDLIGRKTMRDKGQSMKELIQDMRETLISAEKLELTDITIPFDEAVTDIEATLNQLINEDINEDLMAARASAFLQMISYVLGAWGMLKRRIVTTESANRVIAEEQKHLSQFYMTQILPRYRLGLAALYNGASVLAKHPQDLI